MLICDMNHILEIQVRAYPGFLLESADFFLNRLALAPAHCWVAQADPPHGEEDLLGYLISYPWNAGPLPTLDTPLAESADHWFLHDCAVASADQGLGVGQALCAQ